MTRTIVFVVAYLLAGTVGAFVLSLATMFVYTALGWDVDVQRIVLGWQMYLSGIVGGWYIFGEAA